MKKIILTAVIILLNTFTACKYTEKDKTVIESTQTAITTTVETNIETSLSESESKNTETKATEVTPIFQRYPEDDMIRAYEEVANESRIYFGDMFYDLDSDGIFEYIKANGDNYYGSINGVYKYIDGEVVKFGNFNLGGDNLNATSGLSKYYDPKTNEYFYIAESDIGDKLIGYVAEIERFQFNNNEYKKSTIAKCEYTVISTDGATNSHINILSNTFLGKENTPIGMQKISDLTCYYDGVKEYLSQFTKIEEIEMTNVLFNPYNYTYDNLYYNYYIKDKESSSSLINSDTTEFSSAD